MSTSNCICQLDDDNLRPLFKETKSLKDFKESVPKLCTVIDIDDSTLVNFNESPDYDPSPEGWFYLETNNLEEGIKKGINKIYEYFRSSAELPHIDNDTLGNIKLIMYGDETDAKLKINFQVIQKSKFLKGRRLLAASSDAKLLDDTNILHFSDETHFILCEANSRIYFKKLYHLAKLHNKFKELYKEASAETLEEVFTNKLKDLVDIKQGLIENGNIGTQNLKKVNFLESAGVFQKITEDAEKLLAYLKDFESLKKLVKDDKIHISKSVDMTAFLKACNEQFFYGALTGEPLMANASKKIDS